MSSFVLLLEVLNLCGKINRPEERLKVSEILLNKTLIALDCTFQGIQYRNLKTNLEPGIFSERCDK